MANPLRMLNEFAQSVWLDFVSRELLKSGGLAHLIAEDGLRGVTSNPSIFEKAIGHGDDYDALIAEAEASGDLDPGALFEDLAVREQCAGIEISGGLRRSRSRRIVRGSSGSRHPGGRRHLEHRLRADAAARRLY